MRLVGVGEGARALVADAFCARASIKSEATLLSVLCHCDARAPGPVRAALHALYFQLLSHMGFKTELYRNFVALYGTLVAAEMHRARREEYLLTPLSLRVCFAYKGWVQ
jgi:hypothetical protein